MVQDMFRGLEMARTLATPEGRRLLSTIQRLVQSEGLPVEQVIRESVQHMEHLEALARQTGRTVKQVADESLALAEAAISVKAEGLIFTCICQGHPQMAPMFAKRGYSAWECPKCLRILIRSLFTGHQNWYVPEGGGGGR